jgi:glycolate oxidase
VTTTTLDLHTLTDLLPAGSLTSDPAALADAASDTSGWTDGRGPAAVVTPGTVSEVQQVLRFADEHRVPVVTRGAGTGLAGGASGTAGSIVLSTVRLDRIHEVSVIDGVAVTEPGVITAELDAAARRHGLFYPPDPASYGISTIGGNIATNAGGLRCVKYGVTRDYVLALDVVLPGGRLLRTGHRSIKGVTGLDLTSLFVGSEGTLGVVVGATVRLRPAPVGQATLVAAFADVEQAAAAVAALAAAPVSPAICELLGESAVQSLRKRSPLPGPALRGGPAPGPDRRVRRALGGGDRGRRVRGRRRRRPSRRGSGRRGRADRAAPYLGPGPATTPADRRGHRRPPVPAGPHRHRRPRDRPPARSGPFTRCACG